MTRLIDLVRSEDALKDLIVGNKLVLVLRVHLYPRHGYIAYIQEKIYTSETKVGQTEGPHRISSP